MFPCATSPSVFVLSACGKLPLCPTDASKFVAAASTPPTLYPISAIRFIDSDADVPNYVQLMQSYSQGLNTVEQLISEEDTQYHATIKRARQIKQDAVKMIVKEMDAVEQKLNSLHASVAMKLANVKSDINIAKTEKDAKLGSTSQLLVDCNGKKTAEFYSPFVADVVGQLKLMMHSQDIPADADTYFQQLFPKVEVPKPPPVTPEQPPKPTETPKKRPAEAACSICNKDIEEVFHACSETVQCLDCFERAVANACFGGRAVCPKCGGVPLEVYRNRGMKECVYCSRKLRLTEVAHWCAKNSAIVCEKCVSRVARAGICRRCNSQMNRREKLSTVTKP